MHIIVKTVLMGCVGYLGVAIVVPSMSFWAEFFMLFKAPFILIWQIIPSFFAELVFGLKDVTNAYIKENPDAALLAWPVLIIQFVGLAAIAGYYVATFFAFCLWIGGHLKEDPNKVYRPDTPEEAEWRRAYDAKCAANAANDSLLLHGLTTNKDIIAAEVQANAIAGAMGNYR